MMLEEFRNNEAMEQPASGSTSKAVAPTEVFNTGGSDSGAGGGGDSRTESVPI